jgi:hypothetical protein
MHSDIGLLTGRLGLYQALPGAAWVCARAQLPRRQVGQRVFKSCRCTMPKHSKDVDSRSGFEVTAESFIAFLNKCPSLEAISFEANCNLSDSDQEGVMAYLASRKNLKYFKIDWSLRADVTDYILDCVPYNAFQSLKTLYVVLMDNDVEYFIRMIQQVTHLHLCVVGLEDRETLSHLSQLTNLETLE